MKILIRLGAEDRERLGAPEELVLDRTVVTMGELRDIQKATGILAGDFLPSVVSQDADALIAAAWLALKHAGISAELSTLDFRPYGPDGATFSMVTDPEPPPGKGSSTRSGSTTTTRTGSSPRTSRSSRTSSASGRSKSGT